MAHQVSKRGVQPSNVNVKAIAEYAPLQTYTEIRAFLGHMGVYRWFIKGFAQIAQPLNELEKEPAGNQNKCPYLKRLLRHLKH